MQTQKTDANLRFPEATDITTSSSVAADSAEQYLLSGGLFVRPHLVSVEHVEGEQFLVCDELLRCYGVGDTLLEAAVDFAVMLDQYHQELSDSRGRLSQDLRKQLKMFDYFLGRRPA